MAARSTHPPRRSSLTWLVVTAAVAASTAQGVDFAHEVVPILRKHCGECHTGDARQGGFSLNTREDLLAGGDSGTPGLVSGESATSELVARITSDDPDDRMPSEGEPLPPESIAILKAWIDEQAPWEAGFAFKGTAWEPPLALREISLPPAVEGRMNPVDRIVDAHLTSRGLPLPPRCDDRTFVRRASLDLVGLLPAPDRVEAFVADTDPEKRTRLVCDLLADDVAYADHWLTFWNDLLRNDYTGTGFITGGRRQITTWLHRSLAANVPFDQFVRELVAPGDESRGFIDGIVWRGTVNASQTVPIQFAQNLGQTFLGINLKCASCHDSFVDRWTLRQTYDLAAIVSEQPLELARCDKATGVMATPAWIFPDLGQIDASLPPSARLAELAALITKPGNGWLSRTLANRLWYRLMGRGIVHPVDSLRSPPWSEDLLDLLAGELVSHGWDVRHLLNVIATSEAYGAVTPAFEGPPTGSEFVFRGPLPRRMTAEQLTDAVWMLAGTAPAKPDAEVAAATVPAAAPMVRASLVKATPLMAALGRPNREQVVTSRPADLTTLEAILLANEQSLADEIAKGGIRILAEQGPDPDRITTWIFSAALVRPPTADEAAIARDLLGAPPTANSVADCLWSVVMLPEFQFVR